MKTKVACKKIKIRSNYRKRYYRFLYIESNNRLFHCCYSCGSIILDKLLSLSLLNILVRKKTPVTIGGGGDNNNDGHT